MKKTLTLIIVCTLVFLSACGPNLGSIQPTSTSGGSAYDESGSTSIASPSTPVLSSTFLPSISFDVEGVDIEPIRTHRTIAVLPLTPLSSNEPSDSLAWTLYSTDDGWTKSLLSIAVESSEVLWFGTLTSGIVRFDGKTWSRYTTEDGLADNAVRELILTPDGNLWVGTAGGGISYFNGKSWITYTTKDGLAGNHIQAMELAPDGTLWVATDTRGLSYFDGQAWRQAILPDEWCPIDIFNITISADGDLWAGGVGCISHFDGTQWFYYMLGGWTYVSDMLISPNGVLWFGHGDTGVPGFSSLEGEQLVYYTSEDDSSINGISALAIDGAGGLWVGGYRGGITYFDGEYARTSSTPFGVVKVFDIAVTDGVIWITSDKGLIRYSPSE